MSDFCSCWKVVNGKAVCYGTKELDVCSCGGVKNRCDFYEQNRVKTAPLPRFKTTKDKLMDAEIEICELKRKLQEKEDELSDLRATLRSLSKM